MMYGMTTRTTCRRIDVADMVRIGWTDLIECGLFDGSNDETTRPASLCFFLIDLAVLRQ